MMMRPLVSVLLILAFVWFVIMLIDFAVRKGG